jgi:hypothetical protein
MGKVIEVETFQKCAICHKRQATLLCDMPSGRTKTMHMKKPDGTTDYENSVKEYTNTCDEAICSDCSIEVTPGIHFCKQCMTKLKGSIKI